MSVDLYASARSARDILMRDLRRVTDGREIAPEEMRAQHLAAHLNAVIVAFLGSLPADTPAASMVQQALGIVLGGVADNLRVRRADQQPSLRESAVVTLNNVARRMQVMVDITEAGLSDSVVTLSANAEGTPELQPFDFAMMMKGREQ